MKLVLLALEGMADEPVESLENRTPLEMAKTPNMDRLAKAGMVGTAQFGARELPATSDVACFSMLGYDPAEFYTGIGPLDAAAFGHSAKDPEVIFRCDLVTALDDVLVDPTAGGMSPTEARLLIEELDKKLSSPRLRFRPGRGYKNLLIAADAELAEDLDALECAAPSEIVGQKYAKHLPKGKAQALLLETIEKAKAILEAHDVNRVRIDLGENPANLIWPWGQGRNPRLPGFKARHGLSGAVVSKSDFARGLGALAGLEAHKDLEEAIAKYEFVFSWKAAEEPRVFDLKTKVRAIEEFDSAVVGPALKAAEAAGARVCVTTGFPESLAKASVLPGPVPFVLAGPGVEVSGAGSFGEKAAALGKPFMEGHKLMIRLLAK